MTKLPESSSSTENLDSQRLPDLLSGYKMPLKCQPRLTHLSDYGTVPSVIKLLQKVQRDQEVMTCAHTLQDKSILRPITIS